MNHDIIIHLWHCDDHCHCFCFNIVYLQSAQVLTSWKDQVQNQTKGVDVHLLIVLLSPHHLWCHILPGAHQSSHLGCWGCAGAVPPWHDFAKPKVSKLHLAVISVCLLEASWNSCGIIRKQNLPALSSTGGSWLCLQVPIEEQVQRLDVSVDDWMLQAMEVGKRPGSGYGPTHGQSKSGPVDPVHRHFSLLPHVGSQFSMGDTTCFSDVLHLSFFVYRWLVVNLAAI